MRRLLIPSRKVQVSQQLSSSQTETASAWVIKYLGRPDGDRWMMVSKCNNMSPGTTNQNRYQNMRHQTCNFEPCKCKNNDFDTSFTVANENRKTTKVASMKLTKNSFQFWHSIYKCFHDFYENHAAQRWPIRAPRSQNHDFDTIFTVVIFKSGRFVRSFSMRCQEALDGSTTSESIKELQQQRAVSQPAPNRRRVTSSYEGN